MRFDVELPKCKFLLSDLVASDKGRHCHKIRKLTFFARVKNTRNCKNGLLKGLKSQERLKNNFLN